MRTCILGAAIVLVGCSKSSTMDPAPLEKMANKAAGEASKAVDDMQKSLKK